MTESKPLPPPGEKNVVPVESRPPTEAPKHDEHSIEKRTNNIADQAFTQMNEHFSAFRKQVEKMWVQFTNSVLDVVDQIAVFFSWDSKKEMDFLDAPEERQDPLEIGLASLEDVDLGSLQDEFFSEENLQDSLSSLTELQQKISQKEKLSGEELASFFEEIKKKEKTLKNLLLFREYLSDEEKTNTRLLGEILETTKVALWEKGLVPDTSTKPIGLSNPTGSACYRNSVNQMLAIPYFKNMVLEGCRSPVASALLDLWSSQYDPNTRVVNDEKLLDQLCESGTMGELNEATKYRQQDASQYLEALFAEINYQMEFEETLERDGYELNRINVEETMLHLSKSETIEEAFSNFINTVTDTNVEKNLRMNSAPPEAMVVNVKRKIFTDEGYLYDNSPMKIAADNKVDFSELYSQPPGSVTYELQGFVWFTLGEMDEGGENSGHYIAYVKRGEDWYQCNDDKITKIDLSNPWNVRVFNIRKNQCVLGTFVKTP